MALLSGGNDGGGELDPAVAKILEEHQGSHDHGMPDSEVLRTPVNRGVRVLFYEFGCNFCHEWVEIIEFFNAHLPVNKRISVVDIESTHPLVEQMGIEAAPTLVIDGIMVRGITTQAFGEGFLKGYLGDELKGLDI